ncbi:MAG: threonine--tRNA ligase, partial [Candidatus Korarchaeota archaeon]|nr:threonine--tRNA ligase [Candidatus Korarchaeota archaeon]
YIIVVGERERSSEVLPVRDRKSGTIREIQLEELISEIKKILNGKPYKPLPLPNHLSRRPQFYG